MGDFFDRLSEHVTLAGNRMRRHATYPCSSAQRTRGLHSERTRNRIKTYYSCGRVLSSPIKFSGEEEFLLKTKYKLQVDKWRASAYERDGRKWIVDPCINVSQNHQGSFLLHEEKGSTHESLKKKTFFSRFVKKTRGFFVSPLLLKERRESLTKNAYHLQKKRSKRKSSFERALSQKFDTVHRYSEGLERKSSPGACSVASWWSCDDGAGDQPVPSASSKSPRQQHFSGSISHVLVRADSLRGKRKREAKGDNKTNKDGINDKEYMTSKQMRRIESMRRKIRTRGNSMDEYATYFDTFFWIKRNVTEYREF